MSKPIAWSFSSLSDFYNCPLAYKLKRVTKEFPLVETEAMRYGAEIHKHLELRARDKTPLPDHLKWTEAIFQQVEGSGMEMSAEARVALDRSLKPVGWFDRNVWVRCVFDLVVRGDDSSRILDWKTGKRKFDSDQLMLFAATEFALFKNVNTVKSGYVWLKDKKLDTETFTRADVPSLWGHFMPKVEKLEQAYAKDNWPARPSGLCGWCPAKKSQCKYSKN